MTEPSPKRPQPSRPQPPRPEVVVQPLHETQHESDNGSNLQWKVAAGLWAAAAAMLLVVAAAIAVNWDAVRAGVEGAVAEQDSTATAAEVSDTASATLLSSGAAGAVLLLLAAVGLNLVRSGKPSAKLILAAVGVLTVAASVTFSTFVSGSADLLGGVVQWGPLVAAGLAAVGTVTALVRRH